jgi:hypothetical protein
MQPAIRRLAIERIVMIDFQDVAGLLSRAMPKGLPLDWDPDVVRHFLYCRSMLVHVMLNG